MEICLFYTESFTCPSRAREVFRQMKEMGAATVMFNIYEQDLSRWPKDVPRLMSLAADAGLKRYISPGRHGGVFSGLNVVPSLYTYLHPESLVVTGDGDAGATLEAQTPMSGYFRRFSCVNDPGFRSYMRQELHLILDRLNPDGVLLDEPKGLTVTCGCGRCRELRRPGETPAETGRRTQIEFLGELCEQAKSGRPDRKTMLVVMGDHEKLLREIAQLPSLDVLGASAYWHARGHDIEWLRDWCPRTVNYLSGLGKQTQIWAGNYGLPASQHENLREAYRIMCAAAPDQLCSFWYWRNSDDPEEVMRITEESLRAAAPSRPTSG